MHYSDGGIDEGVTDARVLDEHDSEDVFDLRNVFNRVLNSVASNSARWYEDPEAEDHDNLEDDGFDYGVDGESEGQGGASSPFLPSHHDKQC
jgi:hypothetical protein